jgi:hypothetical protein
VKGANDWPDILPRLWTAARSLRGLRRGALFLFGSEPLVREFPSLHAATHAKAARGGGERYEVAAIDIEEDPRPTPRRRRRTNRAAASVAPVMAPAIS